MQTSNHSNRWATCAAGLLAFALAAAPAVADQKLKNCKGDAQTISKDTVLTKDLSCEDSESGVPDTLHVTKDNVTIDLNGHRAFGFVAEVLDRKGVVFENGAWDTQIVFRSTDKSTIRKMKFVGGRVFITEGSSDNTIVDSKFTAGGSVFLGHTLGHPAADTSGNAIKNNSFKDTDPFIQSITIEGPDNSVTGNTFKSAGGVYVVDAPSTSIRGNSLTDPGDYGIYISRSSATVVANTVTQGSSHGIRVLADATGTLVERNEVSQSAADGINVASTSATITENLAVDNAGNGIEAAEGVIDGGGNQASGNADPQCVNVICTAP